MGDKKNWFKRSLILLLTLMLVCNGMSQTMLTVFAEDETTVPEMVETAVEEQAAEPEDSGNADGAEVTMDIAEPSSDDAGKAQEENNQGEDIGRGAEWFTGEGTISLADIDLPDNDELFAGYVDQLFFGNLNDGSSLFGNFGSEKLLGDSKAVYDELKLWIQQVAAGTAPRDTEVGSSIITQKALTSELTLSLTNDEWEAIQATIQADDSDATKKIVLDKLRPQLRAIMKYLLMDNPYDFFWYDKTIGYSCSYKYRINDASKDISISSINMKFPVSTNFSPEGIADANKRLYLLDTGIISLAKTAAKTAKAIVERYKGKSDYEKLKGYCREICELTSYNYDAVNNDADYGNPWQLIWVFDNNPATEVVCEGYSKAFQYLCDLSDLTDAVCYTVSGYMNGGGHMWNIVTLEGKNYLVDVTNCDGNAIGKPDKLFLAGASGNVADGYTFRLSNDVLYTYDADYVSLFGSQILTLADEKYTPRITVAVDSVEVTYGNAVEPSVIKGSASAADGTVIAGTFAWASGVTTYGTVGTKEIKAVFTPQNPDYSLQTVNVKVTVNRKQITVTADAQEKTYGGEEPKLTYTIDGNTPLVVGDKLSGELTRAAGEDVKDGGYSITQGTLTDENNPNYHIVFSPGTFTITPAEYSGKKEDTKQTKYGNSDTYDLASLLPAGAKLGAVNTPDADGIFVEGPVLNGTVLSYKLNPDTDKIGKTAVITVPVTETTNYKPFTITITVVLSDKLPQTDFKFDTAEVNKVYGAGDFTVTAKNAVSGSIVTYTSSDPAVAQVDAGGKVHILKKGSVVITAAASETDDYAGKSVTYKLTVSPKPLAWDTSVLYARDKQGEVANMAASLYGELRVSGILSSDASKVVFNCPASKLTGTYADDKPGQKKVTLAWAGEQAVLEGEGADNYTMPPALPEITGTINAVSEQENVPESTETIQYKLEVESGISQVPAELKKIDSLNTPAKIEGQMKSIVKQKLSSAGGVEVYDVVLMVNKENGGWVEAEPDNFPEGGVTVTLPYPAGTGKDTHNFAVAHMFTIVMNGHQPGEIEYPAVTKTDAGIQFKVTSLSPIAIGAEEIRAVGSGGALTGTGAGNSASGRKAARTGDESNILLYVLLMMLGAAGIGFSARRKQ